MCKYLFKSQGIKPSLSVVLKKNAVELYERHRMANYKFLFVDGLSSGEDPNIFSSESDL